MPPDDRRKTIAGALGHRVTALARTLRTFGWAASSQFGRQALQLVSVIILARLLSPQDFGVMSLAMVVTGFVALFRDLGTGAALIQRQGADARLASSLFSLNSLLSVSLGLFTAAVAPVMAAFFHAPSLRAVLQVLAFSLAIAGLGVVPQAVLERERRFDQLARIELSGAGAGALTAVAMAYYGWGIWSLVAQTTVAAVLTTVAMIVASGARPTLHPDWKLLRSVAGYSLNLAGSNVFNYLMRNADNAIIGKFLGTVELGYYALAYQIAVGPVRSIGAVVGRVLFPSLARIQHDLAALRAEYLGAVSLMTSICFPVLALLVALADVATVALLGESWGPMVPILVVLGLVGFVQSPSIATGSIYITTGRTDILMRWGLVTNTLAILAFWVGTQWGAFGVAAAYLVFSCSVAYPWFYMLFRLYGLPVSDVLRAAAGPAIGAVVAGLVAWLTARGVHSTGAMAALVSGTSAGVSFWLLWYAIGGHLAPLKLSPRD